MPQRLDPTDPREWLNRSRSSLQHARSLGPGVYLEDLCFDAQQAAEKAIKALFVHRQTRFPYIHNLENLLALLSEEGLSIPDQVWEAKKLTPYAFEARYPAVAREVTEAQHAEALRIAEAVVCWAESIILGKCPEPE